MLLLGLSLAPIYPWAPVLQAQKIVMVAAVNTEKTSPALPDWGWKQIQFGQGLVLEKIHSKVSVSFFVKNK